MAIIDASNAAILNAVRANASLSYRDRIPVATDANLEKTMREIRSYTPHFNEFADTLINRIGLTLLDQNLLYENKLKPLKSGAMQFGGMVQELAMDLIKGEEYDADDTNVFNAPKPYIHEDFHCINRRNKYPFKLNSDLLEEAVINDGQLGALLNYTFASANTSGEQDEYLLMLELLGHYQKTEPNGFANLHVEDIATASDPKTAATELSRTIREAYMYNKGFLRSEFNPAGVPCAAPDLVLLITPKALSYMDVYVLANAFHMDKADFMADRVIVVDQWPEGLSGTQAMLLDRNFYRVYDCKRRMVNQFNVMTLDWIYVYHIWQVMSVSRMKTALRFSTDASNVSLGNATTPKTATAVTITVAEGATTFTAGDVIQLGAEVTYDDGTTDGNAYFIITGVTCTGESESVIPNTGTYVDREGKLHVADDCTFVSLQVTAVATGAPTVVKSATLANTDTSGELQAAVASVAANNKADALKAIVDDGTNADADADETVVEDGANADETVVEEQ